MDRRKLSDLINSISKNPIAKVTLNGERLNIFLLRLRARQGSNNPIGKLAKDMKRHFTKRGYMDGK